MKSLRSSPYIKPFVTWVIWLTVGTSFYATRNRSGWSKGFYMAVNVGYSIGWGYPVEIDESCKLFSIFFCIAGASAVAAALQYFAHHMIKHSKKWYVDILVEDRLHHSTSFRQTINDWIEVNIERLYSIALWVIWVASMVVFWCTCVNYSAVNGIYFAISSLSTGGLYPIPNDSPDWMYAMVGMFTATGVPLTCIAMTDIVALLFTVGDPNEMRQSVISPVTRTELDMLRKLRMEDGDGKIDRAEYVVLCAFRLGALPSELIAIINENFDALDAGHRGFLDLSEILVEDLSDSYKSFSNYEPRSEKDGLATAPLL